MLAAEQMGAACPPLGKWGRAGRLSDKPYRLPAWSPSSKERRAPAGPWLWLVQVAQLVHQFDVLVAFHHVPDGLGACRVQVGVIAILDHE